MIMYIDEHCTSDVIGTGWTIIVITYNLLLNKSEMVIIYFKSQNLFIYCTLLRSRLC